MQTKATAREHLNWATNRALEYFDTGDKKNAFASFLSDVTKHDGTVWIASHSATMMLLEVGWQGGRSEFKRMMEDFAVSDQPSAAREEAHSAPFNTATEEGAMQTFFGALAGDYSGNSIVAQEAAGQASFVNSDTLPREMSVDTMFGLVTAGVKFGDPVPGDDLFVYVELPEGWKRQGTSHDMHSNLLDEKGRKRAGIFYKAAFYDRRADLHIVTRFRISSDYDVPEGTITVRVMDFDTEVFSTSESYMGAKYEDEYNDARAKAFKQCEQWLNQNGFPEWKNPGLYWD